MTDRARAAAERSVRTTLAAAAADLAGTSATPRLDAELLMAHALAITREAMLLRRLDDAAPAAFDALLGRRLSAEPVAYITGARDFWTVTLAVTPAVLVPRADSETLIEAAIAFFSGPPPSRILDLGTGSGALLLAALDQWPTAGGVGVDASHEALEVACANAAALGLAGRAMFRRGDWGGGLAERFDLVLCNPPYLEDGATVPAEVRGFEPHAALFAGPDGLACYRALAPQLGRLLAPGGLACVEIGAAQAAAVTSIFAAHGLATQIRRDLGGRDRCLTIAG